MQSSVHTAKMKGQIFLTLVFTVTMVSTELTLPCRRIALLSCPEVNIPLTLQNKGINEQSGKLHK